MCLTIGNSKNNHCFDLLQIENQWFSSGVPIIKHLMLQTATYPRHRKFKQEVRNAIITKAYYMLEKRELHILAYSVTSCLINYKHATRSSVYDHQHVHLFSTYKYIVCPN